MQTEHFVYFFRAALLVASLLATFAARCTAASGPQIIYSFAGDSDGEYLDTDLVIDSSGNLYGTSVQGGDFASGTVWELSPTPAGWVHTVLYSFTGGADGGEPYKGATLDAQGNLYGTAVTGGGGSCEGGCGVIWKLTHSSAGWTQSVIHTFTGGEDGSGPGTGLTLGENGTLFGMTPTGGAYGQGVVFRLSPTTSGGWSFRVLHPFTGGDDGGGASAGRLLLYKGSFYGVTTTGGANGQGVVFQLTRTAGVWQFSTLYAFKGQPDAGFPYGGLAVDSTGSLYGTTYYSGVYGLGSVYELSIQPDGTWKETVLYSFQGGKDGSGSIGNLVFTNAGTIYGTTSAGGASCDCGTIFKLTAGIDGSRKESVVYRFHGAPDGAFAYNGMVGDSAGNFYGTTVHGGPSDDGLVYKLTP